MGALDGEGEPAKVELRGGLHFFFREEGAFLVFPFAELGAFFFGPFELGLPHGFDPGVGGGGAAGGAGLGGFEDGLAGGVSLLGLLVFEGFEGVEQLGGIEGGGVLGESVAGEEEEEGGDG